MLFCMFVMVGISIWNCTPASMCAMHTYFFQRILGMKFRLLRMKISFILGKCESALLLDSWLVGVVFCGFGDAVTSLRAQSGSAHVTRPSPEWFLLSWLGAAPDGFLPVCWKVSQVLVSLWLRRPRKSSQSHGAIG